MSAKNGGDLPTTHSTAARCHTEESQRPIPSSNTTVPVSSSCVPRSGARWATHIAASRASPSCEGKTTSNIGLPGPLRLEYLPRTYLLVAWMETPAATTPVPRTQCHRAILPSVAAKANHACPPFPRPPPSTAAAPPDSQIPRPKRTPGRGRWTYAFRPRLPPTTLRRSRGVDPAFRLRWPFPRAPVGILRKG